MITTVWTTLLAEAGVAFIIALAAAVWAQTRLRMSIYPSQNAGTTEPAAAADRHSADHTEEPYR